MKAVKDINLPENLKYSADHVWVKPDGNLLVAGVSDFAQDQLGEVAYVDLPEKGSHLESGIAFGTVESIKTVNSLFMPVSGEIVEVNKSLEDSPEKVNTSCYEEGWIIKIKPDDPQATAKLLNATDYRADLEKA